MVFAFFLTMIAARKCNDRLPEVCVEGKALGLHSTFPGSAMKTHALTIKIRAKTEKCSANAKVRLGVGSRFFTALKQPLRVTRIRTELPVRVHRPMIHGQKATCLVICSARHPGGWLIAVDRRRTMSFTTGPASIFIRITSRRLNTRMLKRFCEAPGHERSELKSSLPSTRAKIMLDPRQ